MHPLKPLRSESRNHYPVPRGSRPPQSKRDHSCGGAHAHSSSGPRYRVGNCSGSIRRRPGIRRERAHYVCG
jgi:hypothetical protein